jgi:hypothetical protein
VSDIGPGLFRERFVASELHTGAAGDLKVQAGLNFALQKKE